MFADSVTLESSNKLTAPANTAPHSLYFKANNLNISLFSKGFFDIINLIKTHKMAEKEQELLTRFALALGFTPGNVNYIVDKALKLVDHKVDLDTFTYEMQHMNK